MAIDYKNAIYSLTASFATQRPSAAVLKTVGTGWAKRSGLPAQQYNQTANLVGWWRLRSDFSSSGNVTDSSGNGRSGTFDASNNRPSYSTIQYPSTYIQTASNAFDGSTDMINIGTAATWDALVGSTGTSKISISSWVYKTASSSDFILRFGGGDIELKVDASDKVSFKWKWTNANTPWICSSAISLNVWTHIAVAYDANAAENIPTIFINGNPADATCATSPSGSPIAISGLDTYIGMGISPGSNWTGNLADIVIWDSELTQNDVKALYGAKTAQPYSSFTNWSIKASTASPMTGAIEYTYQGIYAKSDKTFFGSLLPRMTFGPQLQIVKNDVPISKTIFDDTLTINNDVADVRGTGDLKTELVISFDMGRYNYGQPPTTQQGEPFAETETFNAVKYLKADEETMWPVNLWNAGSLIDHEYDGVIEPLDIRGEILGTVDTRYEGHAIRASMGGPFAASTLGNHAIKRTWMPNEEPPVPFLDAPDVFGLSLLSGSRISGGHWSGNEDYRYYGSPLIVTDAWQPDGPSGDSVDAKAYAGSVLSLNATDWLFANGGGLIAPRVLAVSNISGSADAQTKRPTFLIEANTAGTKRPKFETANSFGPGTWTVEFFATRDEGAGSLVDRLFFTISTNGGRPRRMAASRIGEWYAYNNTKKGGTNKVSFTFEAKGMTHMLRAQRSHPDGSDVWIWGFRMYQVTTRANQVSGPISKPGRWETNSLPGLPFFDSTAEEKSNVTLYPNNPPIWRTGQYNLIGTGNDAWRAGQQFKEGPNVINLRGWWKLDADISASGSATDYSAYGADAWPSGTLGVTSPMFMTGSADTPSFHIQETTSFFTTASTGVQPCSNLVVSNSADNHLSFTNALTGAIDANSRDQAFSVSFRIKPEFNNGVTMHPTIVSKGFGGISNSNTEAEGISEWVIFFYKTNSNSYDNRAKLAFRIFGGVTAPNLSYIQAKTNDYFDAGTWYDIVCTYDGLGSYDGSTAVTGMNIYSSAVVQPVQEISATGGGNANYYNYSGGGMTQTGGPLVIGRVAGGGDGNVKWSNEYTGSNGYWGALPLSGTLCDLSVWTGELTSLEIQALSAAQSGTMAGRPTNDRLIDALEDMSLPDDGNLNRNLKQATTGFYFNNKAGSITFGDI